MLCDPYNFGSTVGYPSDSLASCTLQRSHVTRVRIVVVGGLNPQLMSTDTHF